MQFDTRDRPDGVHAVTGIGQDFHQQADSGARVPIAIALMCFVTVVCLFVKMVWG